MTNIWLKYRFQTLAQFLSLTLFAPGGVYMPALPRICVYLCKIHLGVRWKTWLILTRVAQIVAAWQPGCEEMEREWGNEEEMERKWGNGERLTLYISSFSLYFLPLSPFPPSLSISYIKMHHILLQNVKYSTFVANVTKISTCALWGNNSRQTWLHM